MKQIQQQPSIETTLENTIHSFAFLGSAVYIFHHTQQQKVLLLIKNLLVTKNDIQYSPIFLFEEASAVFCFYLQLGFMDITFLGSRWFYLRPQRHPSCGLTCFVSKSTTFKFIVYVRVCTYVRSWHGFFYKAAIGILTIYI